MEVGREWAELSGVCEPAEDVSVRCVRSFTLTEVENCAIAMSGL